MKALIFPLLMALALLVGCKGTEEKPAQTQQKQTTHRPGSGRDPGSGCDGCRQDAGRPCRSGSGREYAGRACQYGKVAERRRMMRMPRGDACRRFRGCGPGK